MHPAFRSLTSRATVTVIGALLNLCVPSVTVEAQEASRGFELFHTLKCQLCHSVPAADIEAKTKSDKIKGADLGTPASQLTAEEMSGYIRREAELDGKQHKKEFKGTDEELAVIIDWLLELSQRAKEGEGEG